MLNASFLLLTFYTSTKNKEKHNVPMPMLELYAQFYVEFFTVLYVQTKAKNICKSFWVHISPSSDYIWISGSCKGRSQVADLLTVFF